jgi:hypothetical protein
MPYTYIGDLGSHHVIVQAGDLRVVLISIATQLEPQGPVRYHHRTTNQLEYSYKVLVLKIESRMILSGSNKNIFQVPQSRESTNSNAKRI